MPFFMTSYQIIGDDCSGTYLVNAKNKTAANKLVKSFDNDYTRVRSELVDESKIDPNDFFCIVQQEHLDKVPNDGDFISLESGT